jgi:hypothetical protein
VGDLPLKIHGDYAPGTTFPNVRVLQWPWSSTKLVNERCGRTAGENSRLDNAFALIEGHEAYIKNAQAA